jgi:superfamily I DNA and RNA helicase
MPKRNFYVKEEELDDYQIKIINRRTDSSLIVQGCAGSGKSILALWKAKQIQNEKKGNFLFVIFTKALKQYMKDGISQIGLSADNVENFHSCFQWRKDENDKWQGTWKKGTFDYLIVDEAQDFSQEDILLFKSKAQKLLLYGDSAQQLYKFFTDKTAISMLQMANITGFPMEQLVFNHRLPKKIARLAEKINTDNDDLETRCKNEGVELPKILKYSSFEA